MKDKHAVPCAFALMPDKNTASYHLLQEQLLEVVDFPLDLPVRIVLDYERTVWKTMSGYLPMAKLTGCLFHFEQAILRKLQALGLISLFNQNEQFSFLVCQVQALPFVPVDSVVKYCEETVLAYMETLHKDENFSEYLERFNVFVTYLERTWIGSCYSRNERRRVALFPIKDWNHYSDVLDGRGTTNNISES
jgi:hypothetical protein